MAAELVPVARALKSMKRSNSGVTWIRQRHVTAFLKDLAAAHGIAAAHRLDLPVTSLAHRLFEELSRTAAGCDISAMALATERRNPPHRIGTGSDRLPEA